MDRTAELISSYVVSLGYSLLPAGTVHETKRRIIDALGCAIGGYDSEPARIARRLAATTSSTTPSRILGGGSTSPEMAAFANTVMVGFLDCNDTFISNASGHPSDMLPAALAVGDPIHASGKQIIAATVLAYEVYGALGEHVPLEELGWDQGIFAVVGSACAAGNMLGLSQRQMSHAVSLAVVPNLPLRQTRVGELSMWKGCATAAATRNGVFAAVLAREGMEGPNEPFEGRHGMWERATGPMELGPFGGGEVPFKIDQTSLKYYPSQIHTQVPISLALKLRERVPLEEVEAINLQTYSRAWSSAGSETEKWDPQTRETADHSIPYVVAVALADGTVTPASFSSERIGDHGLRSVMGKIKIEENPEFTLKYPDTMISRMEVVTRSGERLVETAGLPKGHPKNPITDTELEQKFFQPGGSCPDSGAVSQGAGPAMEPGGYRGHRRCVRGA